MNRLWDERLLDLLERHESAVDALIQQIRLARAHSASVLARLEALDRSAAELIERLQEERQALVAMKTDPVVLTRVSGPHRETYHSATHPCRRVLRQGNFTALLWTEAKQRGLRPCAFCGDRVLREAARADA